MTAPDVPSDADPGADPGADAPMSWFPVADDDELDAFARELFAKCEERLGHVPNVFRAYAWRGQRFERWQRYFASVMRPTDTLGAAERESIAVAVSMANGCLYCLVAHGLEVRRLLGPVLGDQVTLDWRRAPLPDRWKAMLAYAEKVATTPRLCTREDVDALKAHGLTDEDVWDVAEVASLYSATNRMAMATGMLPNARYHGEAR